MAVAEGFQAVEGASRRKSRAGNQPSSEMSHPGRGQFGFCHLRVATCPKKRSLSPALPSESEPRSCSFEAPHALIWWSFHPLLSVNHWKCFFLKIRLWFRTEVLPLLLRVNFFRLARFNLKYFPVQRYQNEGKHFLDCLDFFVFFF